MGHFLQVTITTRHLMSHLSGIRHYTKKGEKEENNINDKEYFIKEHYDSIENALKLFQDDELLYPPGIFLLSRSPDFVFNAICNMK